MAFGLLDSGFCTGIVQTVNYWEKNLPPLRPAKNLAPYSNISWLAGMTEMKIQDIQHENVAIKLVVFLPNLSIRGPHRKYPTGTDNPIILAVNENIEGYM